MKNGNLRRVVGEEDEIFMYQDFAKRLALNFDEFHEDRQEIVHTSERPEQRQQQQPKHEKPAKIATRAR